MLHIRANMRPRVYYVLGQAHPCAYPLILTRGLYTGLGKDLLQQVLGAPRAPAYRSRPKLNSKSRMPTEAASVKAVTTSPTFRNSPNRTTTPSR